MNERVARVRRALSGAPADLLVDRLAAEMAHSYRITSTELFQVDYRMSALLPLSGGDPVTAPGHPAWRCFDHQDGIRQDGVGYYPVSFRGERLGVLRLSPLPEGPGSDPEPAGSDPELADSDAELAEAALVLAHELAAVVGSTDIYRVARRTRRLTLAAEMQWELLPGRSRIQPSFSLAGQLEPAYAVRGDSFDWSDDGHRLWLSTINGMGEGTVAAMLTTLATGALRNARRAGLSLADQAALADQAIYSLHRGEQHLSALLIELDLASGALSLVDAGSPRLVLLRDGDVIDLPLEAQFPLGMFDSTDYREQRFELSPGDRIFVLSDGVVEATSREVRYGASALERFLRRTGPMQPLDAVRSLLGDLRAFVASDLVDDAVVVCLDWFGGSTDQRTSRTEH